MGTKHLTEGKQIHFSSVESIMEGLHSPVCVSVYHVDHVDHCRTLLQPIIYDVRDNEETCLLSTNGGEILVLF